MQRAALTLRYVDDLPVPEVARVLGRLGARDRNPARPLQASVPLALRTPRGLRSWLTRSNRCVTTPKHGLDRDRPPLPSRPARRSRDRRLSSDASTDSIRPRVTADTPTPISMEPIPMLAKQPKKTRPILLAAACVALVAAGVIALVALPRRRQRCSGRHRHRDVTSECLHGAEPQLPRQRRDDVIDRPDRQPSHRRGHRPPDAPRLDRYASGWFHGCLWASIQTSPAEHRRVRSVHDVGVRSHVGSDAARREHVCGTRSLRSRRCSASTSWCFPDARSSTDAAAARRSTAPSSDPCASRALRCRNSVRRRQRAAELSSTSR